MSERTVLVAIDGSEASVRVARWLDEFFADTDHTLIAAHVAPDDASARISARWPYAGAPHGRFEIQRRSPGGVKPQIWDLFDADGEIVAVGHDVADAVRDLAERLQVDLIVVGSNHKGLLERIISPSTSQELASEAPVPVLIVH